MAKHRIHYIQHVPYEGIGCIDYWVQAKGHVLTSTKMYEAPVVFPSTESFDWLIVLGGPLSVNDTLQFPWLMDEKKFIEAAIKKNKVVIGFCLGAQLIANALNTPVKPNKQKEIGWFEVRLNEAAKQHDLFRLFPESFTTFHWHGETFDLPKNATLLMSSAACHNQAFIYGKKTIGIQFHPEITQLGLKEMIQNMRDDLTGGEFVQTEDAINSQIELLTENQERMRLWLNKLSDVF